MFPIFYLLESIFLSISNESIQEKPERKEYLDENKAFQAVPNTSATRVHSSPVVSVPVPVRNGMGDTDVTNRTLQTNYEADTESLEDTHTNTRLKLSTSLTCLFDGRDIELPPEENSQKSPETGFQGLILSDCRGQKKTSNHRRIRKDKKFSEDPNKLETPNLPVFNAHSTDHIDISQFSPTNPFSTRYKGTEDWVKEAACQTCSVSQTQLLVKPETLKRSLRKESSGCQKNGGDPHETSVLVAHLDHLRYRVTKMEKHYNKIIKCEYSSHLY